MVLPKGGHDHRLPTYRTHMLTDLRAHTHSGLRNTLLYRSEVNEYEYLFLTQLKQIC